MSEQPIGFGVIGAGVIGPAHVEAIEAAADARLVCVCDLIEEKARKLAEEHGAAYATSYAEMLSRDDLEAVCICTPSGLHAEHAVMAAQAGKHILSEKPLDITLEKIDEMILAADENGVRLAGVFQWRTMASSRKLREAVRGGKLGKLVLGDCYQKYNRSHAYYASAGWRATWELDGGGALMNQGVHGVDLIQWIMGKAVRVNAHARRLVRNIPVEDTVVALVEWETGAVGVIEGTTSVTPDRGLRVEISGDDGTIQWEWGKITAWDIPGEEGAEAEEKAQAPSTASDPLALTSEGHQFHVEDLCQAIRTGRDPYVTGRDGRHAVEIIKAIYLSSREGGATIELPLSYEDDGPGIYPRLGSPRLEW